jgi:hypothetical protein
LETKQQQQSEREYAECKHAVSESFWPCHDIELLNVVAKLAKSFGIAALPKVLATSATANPDTYFLE